MSWGRSPLTQAFLDQQVALFRCGQPGCSFKYEGALADWLELRDAHDRDAHNGLRRRKRRLVSHTGKVIHEEFV